MVGFFTDSCTLITSDTQNGTFTILRFFNIKRYSENWFNMGITKTQKQFPEYILDAPRRRLRAPLYHRFVLLITKELVKASYHGLMINKVTLVPRLRMGI